MIVMVAVLAHWMANAYVLPHGLVTTAPSRIASQAVVSMVSVLMMYVNVILGGEETHVTSTHVKRLTAMDAVLAMKV
jgi:hypothetical protein